MCSPPCLLLGPTSAAQLLARCRSERSWFFAGEFSSSLSLSRRVQCVCYCCCSTLEKQAVAVGCCSSCDRVHLGVRVCVCLGGAARRVLFFLLHTLPVWEKWRRSSPRGSNVRPIQTPCKLELGKVVSGVPVFLNCVMVWISREKWKVFWKLVPGGEQTWPGPSLGKEEKKLPAVIEELGRRRSLLNRGHSGQLEPPLKKKTRKSIGIPEEL